MNRPTNELQDAMARHLSQDGLDENLAGIFAGLLLDNAMTWQVESSNMPDECKAILAISFGYQLSPNGNRRPGPVNEALAAVALDHYQRLPRPIYAQCEIAEVLADKVPAADLHAIYPRISAQTGAVKHLGTEEVVEQVAKAVQHPESLSPWLLVSHRHHAVRCSIIASERGFGTVVTPELPDVYDRMSAQPWRKRHLMYLVSDVISRLTMYATHQLYPAMRRAETVSAGRSHQAGTTHTETSRTAPESPRTKRKTAALDQFSDEDAPLRLSDEDYAAIASYAAPKNSPAADPSPADPSGDLSPVTRSKRPSFGGVTDRTQDDTSRAAAAILQRESGNMSARSGSTTPRKRYS